MSLSDYQNSISTKVERWMADRMGKITSSVCPKLMCKGKSATEIWGKQSIDVMLNVAHERRTGSQRPGIENVYSLEFGKQFQQDAIDYYAYNQGFKILACDNDFDEIIFQKPFYGFGDSPDAITDDGTLVAEIKCPENPTVHLKYCALKVEDIKKNVYFWQLIGHLLPETVEVCDFVSYDPRAEKDDPLKIHIVRLLKQDFLPELALLRARIDKANELIDRANKENDMSIIMNVNTNTSAIVLA
jgi:hypothetical protein